MVSIKTLYPSSFDNRNSKSNPFPAKIRKKFFLAVGTNFLYLQLLFLALFSYIFGSLYQQGSHIHNLHVLFVDYDEGAIGQAVRNAYWSLKSKGFPELIEKSAADYPTASDVREAVCKVRYWGAFYVTRGASGRLQDALAGDADASAYDRADVMAYVWNEALYAPTVDAAISANLQLLANTARVEYSTANGTGNITSISDEAISIMVDPWKLQSINIQPTAQGSRAIYNTVAIILILIQEFFYLGTINGLHAQFKVYSRIKAGRIILIRNLISITYTFVGSLCVAGAVWAFRSGWNVNGNQFVLSWMIIWLFAHTNFLTLDVFSIWLPAPFVPMALISWIILNVTSILLPFELSPAFYRVGYMFPAHQVYQSLIDVWSGGCNPHLHYALPILFSWELVSFTLSALGVFRRSHFAILGEESQAVEFSERLDAAVAVELEKIRERRPTLAKASKSEADTGSPALTPGTSAAGHDEDEEAIREELAEAIERVTTRQRAEQEKRNIACGFGPSFNLPFNHEASDDE